MANFAILTIISDFQDNGKVGIIFNFIMMSHFRLGG